MKEYGVIYKATNLINGKIYVGQTKRLLTERRKAHEKAIDDTHFHRAIQKHGKENFKWEIIDKASSKEDINTKEKYWISYYTENNFQLYNLTKGGDGGDTYSLLPECNKQKATLKRKRSLQKVHLNDIEGSNKNRLVKIIETNQLFLNVVDLWTSVFNSSENIFISDIIKSARNGSDYGGFHFSFVKDYKKYINLTTLEIFESCEVAYSKYGQLVTKACVNHTVAYGCYWDYYIEGRQYTKKIPKNFISTRARPIINLCTLKVYQSIASARRYCGQSLEFKDGKSFSANNYWEYYDPKLTYTKVPFKEKKYLYTEKQVNSLTELKIAKSIKVICLETATIFSSITEASNSDMGSKNVDRALKDPSKTANGYHWSIYDDKIDYTKNEFYNKPKKVISRQIICLETAKVYNSIREAELDTGLQQSGISGCIANTKLACGGYHWSVYNKDIDFSQNEFYKKDKHIPLKYKKVQCIQDNLIFENSLEASLYYKCNAKNVQRSASGKEHIFKDLDFKFID